MIILKSPREIELMAKAGYVTAGALQVVKEAIAPGISTGELDRLVEEFFQKQGAIPAFKGYRGFPASICTSLNNQVVHGIPSDKVILQQGDILSVDVGAIVDGYVGDAAVTYPVGEISPTAAKLIAVTERALSEGIERAVEGNHLSDISAAIQQWVEANGFSVVRDLVGHGIGQNMHEEPSIPNYGRPGYGPRLQPGMVFAIEPMVNAGKYHVRTLADDWTVVTADGKLSAHFEHTVAITPQGPRILTTLD
ncbi:MAG TPA: type I methionyl aminopeptidase [Bacillota bacterium]|nr:type I methionyl aminopeptidase [Bacillota bacterium]HPZ23074.1 type I methionyl aminopeptidase [Bacillota bacterium]